MWRRQERDRKQRLKTEQELNHAKSDELLEYFINDDNSKMLVAFRDRDKYDFAVDEGNCKLPDILRHGSNSAMFAAFLGAVKCVHTLVDLSIDVHAKNEVLRKVIVKEITIRMRALADPGDVWDPARVRSYFNNHREIDPSSEPKFEDFGQTPRSAIPTETLPVVADVLAEAEEATAGDEDEAGAVWEGVAFVNWE